jgi:dienelactone hydrolase
MQKNYAEWGGNPAEEYQVKEMLRAVKRTWKVDTDRVYLAGYSMGGYGTWHIGGHQADVFAGLVSGAGGILIGSSRGEAWGWGVVGNLMHTPIAFQHGGKDRPAPPWSDAECDKILKRLATKHPGCYRHKYRFYADKGHNLPRAGTAEAVKWIAQFKRNPYPKKISWEPKRSFNRQFYWLRVKKPQLFTRLDAEIKGNSIEVKTLNLNGGFSVLLNRQLVDTATPVTLSVNGATVFVGSVQPTLSTILITVADRIDERQWFSARIDL